MAPKGRHGFKERGVFDRRGSLLEALDDVVLTLIAPRRQTREHDTDRGPSGGLQADVPNHLVEGWPGQSTVDGQACAYSLGNEGAFA